MNFGVEAAAITDVFNAALSSFNRLAGVVSTLSKKEKCVSKNAKTLPRSQFIRVRQCAVKIHLLCNKNDEFAVNNIV